jgi:hypothetical protein
MEIPPSERAFSRGPCCSRTRERCQSLQEWARGRNSPGMVATRQALEHFHFSSSVPISHLPHRRGGSVACGGHRPSPPGRPPEPRSFGPYALAAAAIRGSPNDIRLAPTPLGALPTTRITRPEIAAMKTCDPRLPQPCPAAPLRVATADARRTPARPAAVVPAARRRRSTPTSRMPEGTRPRTRYAFVKTAVTRSTPPHCRSQIRLRS